MKFASLVELEAQRGARTMVQLVTHPKNWVPSRSGLRTETNAHMILATKLGPDHYAFEAIRKARPLEDEPEVVLGTFHDAAVAKLVCERDYYSNIDTRYKPADTGWYDQSVAHQRAAAHAAREKREREAAQRRAEREQERKTTQSGRRTARTPRVRKVGQARQ